jgi:hypothetical protein
MIAFVEIIPILKIYNAILFFRQLPDAAKSLTHGKRGNTIKKW